MEGVPVIHLREPSYEEWLATLSSKLRRDLRRSERSLRGGRGDEPLERRRDPARRRRGVRAPAQRPLGGARVVAPGRPRRAAAAVARGRVLGDPRSSGRASGSACWSSTARRSASICTSAPARKRRASTSAGTSATRARAGEARAAARRALVVRAGAASASGSAVGSPTEQACGSPTRASRSPGRRCSRRRREPPSVLGHAGPRSRPRAGAQAAPGVLEGADQRRRGAG